MKAVIYHKEIYRGENSFPYPDTLILTQKLHPVQMRWEDIDSIHIDEKHCMSFMQLERRRDAVLFKYREKTGLFFPLGDVRVTITGSQEGCQLLTEHQQMLFCNVADLLAQGADDLYFIVREFMREKRGSDFSDWVQTSIYRVELFPPTTNIREILRKR